MLKFTALLSSLLMILPLAAPAQIEHSREGVLVYLDFEDFKDKSGNGYENKVYGDIKLVDGICGKAGEFDGEATGIELGKQVNPANTFMHDPFTQRTFECLFKADAVDEVHVLYEEGGSWKGFCLRIEDGKLRLAVKFAQGEDPVIAETPFTDTVNWHHVAAVFDEGVLAIYLDGKMVASRKADKTEVPSHGNNGGIGGTFDNNAFGENDKGKPGQVFDGLIDEVYIYSRALPPDEIAKYAQIVTPVPAKGNLPAMWGEVKSR